MSFNEWGNIIVPAIVGIVSSATTFLATKSTNKKDIEVTERQQLSEDEKQFRAELKETIDSYRQELEFSRKEIKALREEVASLHQVNLELTLENRQLVIKVDSLRAELQTFKRGE